MERVVFHIDFDYFYAQCEEVRNPELKTKPVCVCVFSDRGGDSGAIATANYTARKYGVKSGIPISFAKKRLEQREDAVFLPVDFEYYSKMTEMAMKIMKENADIFEYVGRDEAYLDVTKRVEEDFKKALNKFLKEGSSNLITGCIARKNPYFNMIEIKNKTVSLSKNIGKKILSRQLSPKVFDMNASIYIWKRNYDTRFI